MSFWRAVVRELGAAVGKKAGIKEMEEGRERSNGTFCEVISEIAIELVKVDARDCTIVDRESGC